MPSQEVSSLPSTPTRSQSHPPQQVKSPGSTCSNVSDKSKADYSVYVIRNKNKAVVAVLVETKLSTNVKFQHAVAQVRPNRSVYGWGGLSSLLTCRSLATI